jgi:hypothetical protein
MIPPSARLVAAYSVLAREQLSARRRVAEQAPLLAQPLVEP